MVTKINSHNDYYHTDIAYDYQDKPRISVSISSDCDTEKIEGFECDL